MLTTRTIAVALVVLAGLGHRTHAEAQPAAMPHWTKCALHLDWATETRVVREHCFRISMPASRSLRQVGHWRAVRYVSPHIRWMVRFPVFARSPQSSPPAPVTGGTTYPYTTTGYAPPARCGASGATKSGIWPYYGIAAATLPFGTRGYVPGYGPFVVEDTGSSIGPGDLDLYFPSCDQAKAWGVRRLTVTIY